LTHSAWAPAGVVFSDLKESGNDSESFEETNYDDSDAWQASNYANYQFEIGRAEKVEESLEGTFKPMMFQVEGPDTFLDALDSIETADGPRDLVQSDIDENYYLQGKGEGLSVPPAIYVVLPAYLNGTNEREDNEVYVISLLEEYFGVENADIPDPIKFSVGFGYGVYDGGISFGEGVHSLFQIIGTLGADALIYPVHLIVNLTLDTNLKTDTEIFLARVDDFASDKFVPIVLQLIVEGAEVHTKILTGELDGLRDLGPTQLKLLQYSVELLRDISIQTNNLPPYEQGYYTGRVLFEVAGVLLPASKAGNLGKLSKAQFLEDLAEVKYFQSGKGLAALDSTDALRLKMLESIMCFVAGTLIHTHDGLVAIENIQPGMWVLSRDPSTQELDYKQVVQTFVTHPTRLYHLCYRTREGDGGNENSELVSCTGEHPFWVEEKQSFVPTEELQIGNTFLLGNETTAVLESIQVEEAPIGENFTTYNFEVADFHTYFVGNKGVWVHNHGKSPCDDVFNAYYYLTHDVSARLHGKPWLAFDEVAEVMGKDRNSAIFGWAASEVMRMDLKILSRAERSAQWPSHTQVIETMRKVKGSTHEVELLEGTNFGHIRVPDWVIQERADLGSVKSFTLESHHGVPKKIQEWLGMTKDPDSSPAYLTTMLEHRGAKVGIHQKLAEKLGDEIDMPPVNLNQARPAELTPDMIKNALKETYKDFDIEHFWEVCEDWINRP
ncbi:MAG: polymorphic toxin-type HINT domain-containing protein, partial [Verrucomicrobiota bacterium]